MCVAYRETQWPLLTLLSLDPRPCFSVLVFLLSHDQYEGYEGYYDEHGQWVDTSNQGGGGAYAGYDEYGNPVNPVEAWDEAASGGGGDGGCGDGAGGGDWGAATNAHAWGEQSGGGGSDGQQAAVDLVGRGGFGNRVAPRRAAEGGGVRGGAGHGAGDGRSTPAARHRPLAGQAASHQAAGPATPPGLPDDDEDEEEGPNVGGGGGGGGGGDMAGGEFEGMDDDEAAEIGATLDPRQRRILTIFSACRHGRLDAVQAALNDGFPVDERDENGNTLLFVAAQNGSKNATKLCLRNGADMGLQVCVRACVFRRYILCVRVRMFLSQRLTAAVPLWAVNLWCADSALHHFSRAFYLFVFTRTSAGTPCCTTVSSTATAGSGRT